MLRRKFLCGLGLSPMWLAAVTEANAATAYSGGDVARLARRLAAAPYQANSVHGLPDSLATMDYDAYRKIRFRPNKALWAEQNSAIQAQFFHRGFYFKDRVDLLEIVNGKAQEILYDASQFSFEGFDPTGLPADLGFAGFRMHGPLNAANGLDEIVAFLGASYFRAVGKGNHYGLSARGLAIGTGGPNGEEFPNFTTFWLERPAPGAITFTLHALLDSPTASGAYTFVVTPGENTIMDVDARIYPRVDTDQGGIAPLTSMFLFSPFDRGGYDDFRQGVHDSDGLQIVTGAGERVWRPLNNPGFIQESTFTDVSPRGFGLMQRARKVEDYGDFESHFEARPSLWIQPLGKWGKGAVHLFELASEVETLDNIVAFWRPEKPWRAGSEQRFRYRMSWGMNPAPVSALAIVSESRAGRGGPAHAPADTARRYAVTFTADPADAQVYGPEVQAVVTANAGAISNIVVTPIPQGNGARLTFELTPGSAQAVELRANLVRNNVAISETWLNRWTL